MKVFVVWYFNGLDYLDAFTSIEQIFASRESAEQWLDAKFKRVPDYEGRWMLPDYKPRGVVLDSDGHEVSDVEEYLFIEEHNVLE